MNAPRTIWKFNVAPSVEPIGITAPDGAVPLAIGIQADALVMWAEVNEKAPKSIFRVLVVGTGWTYDRAAWQHVDSVQDGAFVWHLLRERTP